MYDGEDTHVRMLEMRISHLEEIRKMRAHYFGNCCPCATMIFNSIYNFFSCVPFLTILAVVPSIIGGYICYSHEVSMIDLTQKLGISQQAKDAAQKVPWVIIFVLVVDVWSVLAAIPTTGPLREFFFGHERKGCIACFQNLFGPCFLLGLLLGLQALFLVFFAGIFVSLPSVTLLLLIWGACKDGTGATKQGMAHAFAKMGKSSATYDFSLQSITDICEDNYDLILSCASWYSLGIILICLGQVCSTVMTMNNFTKLEMTTETPEIEEKPLYAKRNSSYGAEL